METMVHVLLDCPFSQSCWALSAVNQSAPGSSAEFSSWFFELLADGREEVSVEAAMVCWSIWHARNEVQWNHKSRSALEVVKSAKHVLGQWKITKFESPNALFAMGDISKSNCWRKPDEYTVKVNVDGATFEAHQKFGFGCVARDHHGKLIEAISESRWGCVSAEIAEVIGIKEALSWIKRKGWDRVVVESDALVVVQAINSSVHMPSQFGLLVEDCRTIVASLNNVLISYVNRSANRAAHCVARASYLSSGCIFNELNAPLSLCDIVKAVMPVNF
ncbi:hypothetical protein CsatB_027897 [Cannabis sativa]